MFKVLNARHVQLFTHSKITEVCRPKFSPTHLLFRFSRVEVETKQWSASMPVSVVERQATTKRVDGSRKARDAYAY